MGRLAFGNTNAGIGAAARVPARSADPGLLPRPRPPVTPATVPAARRPGAPPPGSPHLQPVVRKAFPAEPAPPDHKSQGQPCPAAPSRSPQPPSGRLPPHPAGPPRLRADGGCQPRRCRSAARPARPPAGAALTLNDILHMSAAAPPGPARFRPGRLHCPASLPLPPPSAEGRPPRRRALPPPQTGPGRVREEGDGRGRRRERRGRRRGRRRGGKGHPLRRPSPIPLPSHPHPTRTPEPAAQTLPTPLALCTHYAHKRGSCTHRCTLTTSHHSAHIQTHSLTPN